MKEETPHRGYVASVFACRCPRCREGKLFEHPLSIRIKRTMKMYERCPVCNQPTDIEIGFYYGTGYLSYLIALGITIVSFMVWYVVIGVSFKDNRFVFWIVFNSVMLLALQPWLMRFSRCLWLSFFVSYDVDWQHTPPQELERINKEQQNNW